MNINKNIIYSAISMAANLVLPLAATPFLLKGLGPHSFGELAIAQAFTIMVCQLIDYGFSLGASRKIAIQRDTFSVTRIYNRYQNARLMLLFLAIVATVIVLSFDILAAPGDLLAITVILSAIGVFFQANWFFHGREQYWWLAVANVIGKSLYLAIAIVAINSSDDLIFAGLIYGLSQLVSGLILQAAIVNQNIYFVIKVNLKKNIYTIISGLKHFASIALLTTHTQLIIILTGHFLNVRMAGDISIIDKVVRGVSAITFPIANTAFSRLSQMYQTDKIEADRLHKRLSTFIITLSCVLSIFVMLFGADLAKMAFQMNSELLENLFLIAAPMPFFIALSMLFGGMKLIPMGFNNEYLYSIVIGELCGIVTFFFFLSIHNPSAGLIAISVTEFVIALSMYLSVKFKA